MVEHNKPTRSFAREMHETAIDDRASEDLVGWCLLLSAGLARALVHGLAIGEAASFDRGFERLLQQDVGAIRPDLDKTSSEQTVARRDRLAPFQASGRHDGVEVASGQDQGCNDPTPIGLCHQTDKPISTEHAPFCTRSGSRENEKRATGFGGRSGDVRTSASTTFKVMSIDPRDPWFDPSTVEAAVFDIGGVFLYPHYDRVTTVLDSLGIDQPHDLVDFRRAHHAGVAALSVVMRPTEEHNPSFWHTYDEAYANTLGVPAESHEDFRAGIEHREWDWVHNENVAAFHALHASGLPLAIVSNNSGAAPEQMKRHGVCWVSDWVDLPRVAAIIDSSLVGVAKPDPAIMTPALHALGLPSEQVVYVGDTVHADVVGATAAGMQSVQLDPFDHHSEYDHARLPDLGALNQALGVS